jgi:16S rRNA (adenine1518-N6/adenine1519-N6)-dimethyltransferase
MTMKLRPKKSLGQHFLYNPAISGRIVDAAGLDRDSVVVELGAGRGILTRPLAATGAAVIALELDRDLVAELGSFLQEGSPDGGGEQRPLTVLNRDRVELLNADFTKLSLTGLLVSRGYEKCALFGNIPYHLTRHVLFSFLIDEVEMISAAYLMMQREVGERIVSGPGSKVYGIPSVVLQCLYDVKALFRVAPGSFHPPPRVDSIVLEFIPKVKPLVEMDDLKRFTQFVKNVFQQRRKTIHNSLKAFYTMSDGMLRDLQTATAIDLQKRPEALHKEELLKIFETIDEVAKV